MIAADRSGLMPRASEGVFTAVRWKRFVNAVSSTPALALARTCCAPCKRPIKAKKIRSTREPAVATQTSIFKTQGSKSTGAFESLMAKPFPSSMDARVHRPLSRGEISEILSFGGTTMSPPTNSPWSWMTPPCALPRSCAAPICSYRPRASSSSTARSIFKLQRFIIAHSSPMSRAPGLRNATMRSVCAGSGRAAWPPMWAMMLSPNSEHLSSVAPGIIRAKS